MRKWKDGGMEIGVSGGESGGRKVFIPLIGVGNIKDR